MTDIQVFKNDEFGAVRTIEQDGKILFCGKDVAAALGYQNTKDALAKHCKGVANRYPLQTDGGMQQARFITEGDLYRLVASSKLPSAQQFESWVFDEVLPSIRKRGGYMASVKDETPEETMARAFILAKETIERKNREIAEMKPKALFADAVSTSDKCMLVGELAKVLRQNGVQMGQKRLFAWLRDNGYLMKRGSSYNLPTQKAMEMELFEVKETAINHSDGHVSTNFTTKVTPKGQQYFINKFLGE